MFRHRLLAGLAVFSLAGTPALAATVRYHGVMSPANEVPAMPTAGTGVVDASYDTATHTLT